MAANDGGGWMGGGSGPVHGAIRGLATAMANAGADHASVSLQGNGSAVVRLEYRLWPPCTCEVCGEPLPHEPPATVQAAAGMVH